MLNKRSKQILTILLVLVLVNRYVWEIEWIDLAVFIIIIGWVAYAYRHVFKTLSMFEIVGMLLFFACIIALLVSFFYFIANPIVKLISTPWVKQLVTITLIIVVLFPAIGVLYKGTQVITKGKFPQRVTDADKESDQARYPKDQEIQKLAKQGKTVEAVKLARKRYGFSLIEANNYIRYLHKKQA